MKYIPLNNQPNVSRTRFVSSSPSMKLDSRGYPHIAWLEERSGRNELDYSFWDGLKWSYLGSSRVYLSEEEINPSPNSIVLDSQDKPQIAFSRKLGSGSRLSLASYDEEWSFNSLDVSYDVGWVGIVKRTQTSESSSSSSGGSGEEGNYYVVAYDVTNSEFKVYAISSSWSLVGSISESITSYSTIKITMCDFKIAIVFIESSASINYNFFDIITDAWSFATFSTLTASTSYGNIIDMDIEGYETSGVEIFCVGWLSGSDYFSYISSARCLSDGSVTPTDLNDYNLEANSVDVISSSSDYLVNGYKKIGVTLSDTDLPRIICFGTCCELFSLSVGNVWSNESVDLEAISNGNVFTYTNVDYSDGVKVSFVADSGDVYYSIPSSDDSFPVANPEIILLNEGDYAYRITSFNPSDGENITGLYDNRYGKILRDARIPLVISSNRSEP